jgi:hypothetical protein
MEGDGGGCHQWSKEASSAEQSESEQVKEEPKCNGASPPWSTRGIRTRVSRRGGAHGPVGTSSGGWHSRDRGAAPTCSWFKMVRTVALCRAQTSFEIFFQLFKNC